MAGMTLVKREGPFQSSFKSSLVLIGTLVDGGGTDSTEVVALAADTQQHIIGGFFKAGAAATLSIYSASTLIAAVELGAAGTIPLPPVYSAAGEALNMVNTDNVGTIFIYVETMPVKEGQPAFLAQ